MILILYHAFQVVFSGKTTHLEWRHHLPSTWQLCVTLRYFTKTMNKLTTNTVKSVVVMRHRVQHSKKNKQYFYNLTFLFHIICISPPKCHKWTHMEKKSNKINSPWWLWGWHLQPPEGTHWCTAGWQSSGCAASPSCRRDASSPSTASRWTPPWDGLAQRTGERPYKRLTWLLKAA